MSDNVIIWQKWADPFGEDSEMPASLLQDADLGQFIDSNSFEDLQNEEEELEDQTTLSAHKSSSVRVIATPMGIIPMNENTASGKIFNFWLGHTNFSLTKNLVNVIENTDGVETLDIFTRYRFRVAIGKAFTDSDVMREINNNVYGVLDYVK